MNLVAATPRCDLCDLLFNSSLRTFVRLFTAAPAAPRRSNPTGPDSFVIDCSGEYRKCERGRLHQTCKLEKLFPAFGNRLPQALLFQVMLGNFGLLDVIL